MQLNEALDLARVLLNDHGLHDWHVVLDNAKRRAGCCREHRKEISLSAPLTSVHPEQEVRDTILHEVAHALVGPGHGHDDVWRAKAVEIGCTAMRCSSPGAPTVSGNWLGRCAAGHTVERHKRPVRVMSCSRCSSSFDSRHLLEWTYRGRPAPMHPNYVAELNRLRAAAESAAHSPLPGSIRPGSGVRITASGAFGGAVGEVLKRGRTRYHVRVGDQVLTVPFALVEPS